MTRHYALAALLALALLTGAAGCQEKLGTVQDPEQNGSAADTDERELGERIGKNVARTGGTYRFVDNETGAICYVVQDDDSEQAAIDCVLPAD